MPAKLPRIAAETVQRSLDLRPDTVTLDAVKAIFMSSSYDAHTNGHLELGHEARDAAASVQELIDTRRRAVWSPPRA